MPLLSEWKRALRRQHWRRTVAWAFVPAVVALGACASSPPHTEREVATTEPVTSSNASCSKLGAYRIIPSANGSFPLLPASKMDADSTPLVRLSSTHLTKDPPTVDLSVALFAPAEPASTEFRGLVTGEEVSFDGYTIRITSICDKDVLFDLVKQPD